MQFYGLINKLHNAHQAKPSGNDGLKVSRHLVQNQKGRKRGESESIGTKQEGIASCWHVKNYICTPTGQNQSKANRKVCTTNMGPIMSHLAEGGSKEAPKVIRSPRTSSTLKINSISESFKMIRYRPQ